MKKLSWTPMIFFPVFATCCTLYLFFFLLLYPYDNLLRWRLLQSSEWIMKLNGKLCNCHFRFLEILNPQITHEVSITVATSSTKRSLRRICQYLNLCKKRFKTVLGLPCVLSFHISSCLQFMLLFSFFPSSFHFFPPFHFAVSSGQFKSSVGVDCIA